MPPGTDLPPLPLPDGVRSRRVDNGNGLDLHLLEAGDPGRPALLLLHGFPEMAFSWRRLMVPLAERGFHVLAPDQRGFGRTTGWDGRYDGDVGSFRVLNLVRDMLGLLAACDLHAVPAVIGHDAGAIVAAWAALVRPDVFRSAVLMSAPFGGLPPLPAGPVRPGGLAAPEIHAALAALPRPRKHYQAYYASREADADMRHCRQGLHAFLRAYFHMKSADWPGNRPGPLAGFTAEALAGLPVYYVMDADQTMAEAVAPHQPDAAAIAACAWLPDAELAHYTETYAATGFQGGLQWYRGYLDPQAQALNQLFAGRPIPVPVSFIAGAQDWGTWQKPGEFERMQATGCARFAGAHLLPGAGHWVQQEQPAAVLACLDEFLGRLA